MKTPSCPILVVAMLGLALGACRQPPPAAPPSPQAGPEAAAPSAPVPAVPTPTETATSAAPLPRSLAPDGAAVTIVSPQNGDIVSSPVKVVFGLQGMTLAPAGDPSPNSGHHHLLVDVPAPDLGQPIPKDEQHLHFGKAQTEVELTLTPGPHTLQLLLGDANHVPQNPPLLSAPITITVK